MKSNALFAVVVASLWAVPVWADILLPQRGDAQLRNIEAEIAPEGRERVLHLAATMQIAGILAVMRQEGLDYGTSLEAEMFPGKGGATWAATVDSIYDVTQMNAQFDAAFALQLAALDPASFGVMEDFFGSARGQRILTLEIDARRALLDDDTEEAAKESFEKLAASDDPSLAQIKEFAQSNDLIEMNVVGTLNSNLAFFKGMAASGGAQPAPSEDEMLREVWAQEPAIRAETESWLFPYLALAYQPLSADDMQAYVAFSDLVEGKALNAAIFAAFNVLFTDISGKLGRAAAQHMRGEDI